MEKLHYSVSINAPVEKVWEIMLSDKGYRKRTNPFNESGCRFEGDRSEGSSIQFLGSDPEHPNDPSKIGGMYSIIQENRKHEYISIKHLGEVNGGKITEEAAWSGAEENYTFSENDGITTVTIDTDTSEEYKDYMDQARLKSMEILKEICEEN